MTENNWTPDPNATYPVAPAYPATNAQYNNPNPYAPNPQIIVQQAPSQTNGMAIAGLICSFFFTPLGLVFSIIGLNKSKELNGEGRGMSIAGIIISAIGIIVGIILLILWIVIIAAAASSSTYY